MNREVGSVVRDGEIVQRPGVRARKHQRAAVSGLSALIEGSPGATARRHRVLNVCERGMLIEGLAVRVGAAISFAVEGRAINYAGSGRVAHRTGRNAGVAVDHWHGAPEAIRALVSGETELGPRADAYFSDWSL
ncbi:MAG: hypothetical protein ABSG43_30345 [Solirubrobacteraceae bacterium]